MATTRGYMLQELDRANVNIEMALTHLARVIAAYEKYHPEISEQVRTCGDALVTVAETIKSIHDSI